MIEQYTYTPTVPAYTRQKLGYSSSTFASPRWQTIDGLPVAELNAPRRAPGPVARVVVANSVSVADADVSVGAAWPRARETRTRIDAAGLSRVPTLVFVPATPIRSSPAAVPSNNTQLANLHGVEHALAAVGQFTNWPGAKIPAGSPGYLFKFDGTAPLEFVGWSPGV